MPRSVLTGLSLAGLCATFVGNGIGRFAYIALMPALIQAGWFSKSDASYLGAATLVGYLLGAPMSGMLLRHYRVGSVLRGAMLACSLSYLACALLGAAMPWYYFWRAMAGFGGAILMVLAAPAVLPQHSPAVRGRVSGVVFSGIGLGAAASGLLIPLLVPWGIASAWLGMGSICLVLTLLTWHQWAPDAPLHPADAQAQPLPAERRVAVGLLLAAYTLDAVGYLPHTLFWVDYTVRELQMPLATGGFLWALFGVGAAIGPLLAGKLGDVFGFKRCLIACFLLKSLGVALPLFGSDVLTLCASSILVGMLTPGIVMLVSTCTLDCVGARQHRRVWGAMTFSFAAAQAAGGYLMAFVAANGQSYRPLFLVSACALLCSVPCIACIRVQPAAKA
ncbi:YbfB/YjiJ family MFS transporter [Verminephrobacter aporrectodeae subsp. tuberculatae]|nr:YbfB/YjiJ family MFS transporter [Verminephrobacter aporrectodeae subsp. tuberculatae]